MSRTDWEVRFDQTVERKLREASAADLPPYETVDVGATGGLEALHSDRTRHLFDGDFYLRPAGRDHPAASLVFVRSANGNTGARNPAVLGGGETDKHLIYEGLSRVAADGVMAGAETIRGTNVVFSVWHPDFVAMRRSFGLPRHPAQVIATLGKLRFDDTLLLNVPALWVIVLTTAEWIARMEGELAERPWITTIPMASPNDLEAAFRTLRSMGIARLSIVGGRTIARALTAAGLVQDLYLTTSPREGGEPGTPLFERPMPSTLVVRKRGTGIETGVVFEHLALAG
jgi:riboflavin biosynthesis pyrimidine reductase